MRRPTRHACLLAWLLAGLTGALFARPAAAQCIIPPGQQQSQPCEDETPPGLSISPGSGIVPQRTITVNLSWNDESPTGTPSITLNGTSVSTAFTSNTRVILGGVAIEGDAYGSVTLANGLNTISATVCDNHNLCSTTTAQLSYGAPGVAVTPDGGSVSAATGTGLTHAFTVRNNGPETATFALAAECRDALTGAVLAGCSAPVSVQVAPATNATISVGYPATTPGQVVSVRLTASQPGATALHDAGWVDVTVRGAGTAQTAPTAAVVDLNSRMSLDPGQCVSIPAGPGAAYECGELRLAYGLPATVVRGEAFAPTLVYHSQAAHPRPSMYANVTIPATSAKPDSVMVQLLSNATVLFAERAFKQDWWPGTTWRIAVPQNARNQPTGLLPYTLQLASVYGGTRHPLVVTDTAAVVNRNNSPFGAGWWLAGLEEVKLVRGDTTLLWVGSDGSTRVYRRVAGVTPAEWKADAVGAPETMRRLGTGFERVIAPGASAVFDATGRHLYTRAAGDSTVFGYDGNGRVTSVTLPHRSGGTVVQYLFSYDAQGKLVYVESPAVQGQTRRDSVFYALGDRRVTSIRGPDGNRVQFGYGGASFENLVSSRTDREGAVMSYTWANMNGGWRLTGASLQDSVPITVAWTPEESKGPFYAIPVQDAFTLLDGPRTDVVDRTWIWSGRWGAPERVRDALGAETRVIRGDARFPALATEVVSPGGLRSVIAYDAKARVDSASVIDPLGPGSGRATTRYAYDSTWDAVNWVRGPDGIVSTAGYNAATGLLEWEQTGASTARRTEYLYHASGAAAGLLAAVRHPHPVTGVAGGAGVDSLYYDAMGNVTETRDRRGLRTVVDRNSVGWDTLAVSPVDSVNGVTAALVRANGVRQRTWYDILGRPVRTATLAPAVTHGPSANSSFVPPASPAQERWGATEYDDEGRVTAVLAWSVPDSADVDTIATYYAYDAAGRVTQEYMDADGVRSYRYDPAGNVVQVNGKRGGVSVTVAYDALGRPVRRTTGVSTYSYSGCMAGYFSSCDWKFPLFPNVTGLAYTVPEEVTYLRYDAAGNLAFAENGDARVERTYYPGGALKTDTLRMRQWGGSEYGAHVYGLSYTYDLAGRLRSLTHPANLNGNASLADSVFYDAATGYVAGIRSRQGHLFSFGYDAAGRRVRTTFPGGVTDSVTLDLLGRPRQRQIPGLNQYETLNYDERGKLATAVSNLAGFTNWYTGLGTLAGTDWSNTMNPAYSAESMRMDALGHMVQATSAGDVGQPNVFRYTAQKYTGRVLLMEKVPPVPLNNSYQHVRAEREYDPAGNLTQAHGKYWGPTNIGEILLTRQTLARYFYGADDRLRATQRYDDFYNGSTAERRGVFEEYRYDPLGRRIAVRARRDGMCTADAWSCTSTLTRYVWAGDQLLYELRVPGSDSLSAGRLETTTATGAAFGRVSYTLGGGMDRPLLIEKAGQPAIVPHANWRGSYAKGTYTNGNPSDCPYGGATGCTNVAWPGWRTTVWNKLTGGNQPLIQNWMGSLSEGAGDASTLSYMRNRYYDPEIGQFTQPDPIGPAGGPSPYAFAAGDPVNYHDPFGLAPSAANCTSLPAGSQERGFCERNTITVSAKRDSALVGPVSQQLHKMINEGVAWEAIQGFYDIVVGSSGSERGRNKAFIYFNPPPLTERESRPPLTALQQCREKVRNDAMMEDLRYAPVDIGTGLGIEWLTDGIDGGDIVKETGGAAISSFFKGIIKGIAVCRGDALRPFQAQGGR